MSMYKPHFFHKIEAKNQGWGLSTDTSVFGVLKTLTNCCSITFSWEVAPTRDVCAACLSVNLALKQFYQTINFLFTPTTEHQSTRNLHSYAQAFAVIFLPRAITTKFASPRTVNHRLFCCFGPPSRQICQLHYQAPVLHQVFHRLQPGFPNIFIDERGIPEHMNGM